MRFIVNQKFWAIRDRFTIADDQGKQWFQVEGKIFTFGKKMTLFDMAGNEVFFLKQRVFSPFARWDLFRGGEQLGTFKKKFFNWPFKRKYTLISGDTTLTMKGSVWGFNFSIFDENGSAGSISKKILKIADTYVIDVFDDNRDPVLFVVAALIIDGIHHRKR